MSSVIDLTQFEEYIYNAHLKASKQNSSQPYKLRKDFSKLDPNKILYLKKLSLFFNKFKHINVDDFFNAPYKVYKDEIYFDLQYYTTLKATKAYTLFQKQQINLDPDSVEQLNNIQKSLIFINTFCRDNNISLKDYLLTKTNLMPSFIIHLKEHKINIYTLLGFSQFTNILKQQNSEVVKFIIGEEVYNNIDIFRTKLFNSQKAILLVQKGLSKIENNLQKKA